MQANQLYLGGTWNFQDQYAQTTDTDETIYYPYDAQHVYFVASSLLTQTKNISITVMRDGRALDDRPAARTSMQTATRPSISRASMTSSTNHRWRAHTLEIIVHNAGSKRIPLRSAKAFAWIRQTNRNSSRSFLFLHHVSCGLFELRAVQVCVDLAVP